MEQYDVELHTLASEIADVDGLNYAEALERAREELGDVQQYAAVWHAATVAASAAYLDALATLDQGGQLTHEQMHTLVIEDQVVCYLWQHGADATPLV